MENKKSALRLGPKKVSSKRKVNRSFMGNFMVFAFLTLFGVFTALPLYIQLVNSIKPLNELMVFPPRFYAINPTFQNFKDMITVMSNSVVPFSRYIFK